MNEYERLMLMAMAQIIELLTHGSNDSATVRRSEHVIKIIDNAVERWM